MPRQGKEGYDWPLPQPSAAATRSAVILRPEGRESALGAVRGGGGRLFPAAPCRTRWLDMVHRRRGMDVPRRPRGHPRPAPEGRDAGCRTPTAGRLADWPGCRLVVQVSETRCAISVERNVAAGGSAIDALLDGVMIDCGAGQVEVPLDGAVHDLRVMLARSAT